jgi:ATP-dependent HslUV protease subunit HslV
VILWQFPAKSLISGAQFGAAAIPAAVWVNHGHGLERLMSENISLHGTTIIAVKKGDKLAIGGDGQVTHGNIVLKSTAQKIRKLKGGSVIAGFAGSTADAFSLLERFESKLDQYKNNLKRAGVELAKEWRTDRALRRLEAMLIAGDKESLILLTGQGDVVEPDDGILGIGSGGAFAQAAARALMKHSTLTPRQIVEESLKEAAAICIFTNTNLVIEEI